MNYSVADIAAVVRLVRESCDLWDDPDAWRGHLLLGACGLLHSDIGAMHTVECSGDCVRFQTLATVGAGRGTIDSVRLLTEFSQRPESTDLGATTVPGYVSLMDTFELTSSATMSRRELCEGQTSTNSPNSESVDNSLDCDDFIVSLCKVDFPQRAELISIDRPQEDHPFGPREVSLLELLHNEIAPLVGLRLATEDCLSRDGLSRRLNETLNLLLEGKSEKEVACELGIRPRTVHEYVTMLYRHFSVTSRAELLAYFIRRRPEKRGILPDRRNGW